MHVICRMAAIAALAVIGVRANVCLAQEAAAGGPPKILSTSPAAGARDVDSAITEITVTFDREMAKGFSWTGGGPAYPPLVEGKRPFWRDERTAVLPVCLSTGRFYRVGINSKSHRNFRSADGVPALPSVITFTTRGGGPAEAGKMARPTVVSMVPANGAAGVDPQTSELRVTFSVPMGGGCSWTGGAGFPAPRPGEGPRWTEDGRTCVLPVRLEPGRQYRLGLNSASCINFQSASGVPLDPVNYTFSTAAGTNRVAAGASSLRTSPSVKMDFSPDKVRMPVRRFPDVSGEVLLGSKSSSVFSVLFGRDRSVPGASVSLYSVSDSGESREEMSTTADAQGKFEFFDVGRGLYRIVAQDTRKEAEAGLSVAMTVEHYRTCDHARLVIHPKALAVKGRVTDALGHPLTNVTVSARQGHERFVPTEGDFTRACHEASAVTDGEGRYELVQLIPSDLQGAWGLEGGGYGGAYAWYTVTITAPGYASAKAYVPVVPEETRRSARRLAGLMRGIGNLLASEHDKAERREAHPVAQPACQGNTLTGVDFVLYHATSVKGTFVGGDGLPQPGCMVLLSRTNAVDACSYQAFTESPLYARCDNEGRFHFFDVAPGAYTVEVYEEHRLVSGKPPRVVTVTEGEPVTGLRLTNEAPPCGKIVGVVSDASSGKPVKGLTVYATHKATGSTEYPPLFCPCGMRGYHTDTCKRWIERALQTNDLRVSTFVVEKAAPGTAELVLKAPDYAEERVTVDVASEAVVKREIKLWRAGTARIRPVLESGARVDSYSSIRYADVREHPPLVHYVAFPEGAGASVSGGRHSMPFGCDAFEGLKPGRYTLRGELCYLSGRVARYETAPLEVASGQTSDVALDFRGPCQLKLKADFPPGTAVSVLLETAEAPVGQAPESNLGLKASAYLQKPGSVLIPDLKPGAYRLSLYRRDVPEKKGVAARRGPDEVKTVTLTAKSASQTISCRF